MHTTRKARRILATVVTGAVIVAGSLLGGSAATAATTLLLPAPTAMAALGDSITQALMTCSSLSGCPVNSWSTGSAASVPSHAKQLGILPAKAFNDSVSGAKASALPAQATKAVGQAAGYVTIEIGANDACAKTVAAMTPVGKVGDGAAGTFATSISTALATLAASPSQPQIFVASIPSLKQLYEVNKSSSSARFTWTVLGICQSMLASPTSTKQTDLDRRIAVQAQVDAYNAVLADVCSKTPRCRFDATVATTVFVASDISTRDYFHPSLAGQVKLAQNTWAQTQYVK